MSETAAHLVDHVLPLKPIRQWVLTFPIPIRLLLAVRPKLMSKALEISHAVISSYYRKKANESGAGLTAKTSKTGAVTLIQRFGGSLAVNIHFHQLFVDGTYELDNKHRPGSFWINGKPEVSEIQEVLTNFVKRFIKYLEKKNIITKQNDDSHITNIQCSIADEDVFSRLQSSSVTYRFATGKSKGKKAIVLKSVENVDHHSNAGLVAHHSGFSLHAGVATKANEREKLEHICRYIARPAVAEERLSINSSGEVVYRFKKPWSDGTTAIKLTPLELMERLAGLVPRPKVHLTRFHGVLAPHYKYRSEVVPQTKDPLQPDTASEQNKTTGSNKDNPKVSKKRISWAKLLKRVFKIDMEACPTCQAHMKIIAAIEDPKIIAKILTHLGLPTKAPSFHPARGPRGPPPHNDSIEFDISVLPSPESYLNSIFRD